MFKLTSALVLALAAASASAQTITGATTCIPAGDYTLCQNLWGESAGTGNQNSTLISTSGNTVSWSTTYTWSGGPNNVKSYANVESNIVQGVQLSTLSSAPTSWSWSYVTESSGIRADVSYDMWLGATASGEPASAQSSYEIMIWLSGLGGIQPVGSQITTGTSVAGTTWNLWSGPNSNWHVYSFVPVSGEIHDFDVDLKDFFDYLVSSQGVSSSQYIQSIQTGTEAFEGTAEVLTSSYSVSTTSGGSTGQSSSSSSSSFSVSTLGTTTPPTSTSTSTRPVTTSTHPFTTTSSTAPGATQTHYGQCGGTGWTGATACASPYTCTSVSPPYYYQCL